MEGVYFVISDGNEPLQIYFTEEDAFSCGALYVDVFDEDGEKIDSLKLSSDVADSENTAEDDYLSVF